MEIKKTFQHQEQVAKQQMMKRRVHCQLIVSIASWEPQVLTMKEVLFTDFKSSGFIGENGQKDKLSYISLLKQIEEGRDKGYSDNSDKEIVNTVLRAITPGLIYEMYLKPQRT